MKDRVAELLDTQYRRADLRPARVLAELARIALADARDLFDANGELKPPCDWSPELGATISEVTVRQLYEGKGKDRKHVGQVVKVRRYDKAPILALLAKHLGLVKDRESTPIQEAADALTTAIAERARALLELTNHMARQGQQPITVDAESPGATPTDTAPPTTGDTPTASQVAPPTTGDPPPTALPEGDRRAGG